MSWNLIKSALGIGFVVFPLQPKSKVPRPGSEGFKMATADEAQVREWFDAYPGANWGAATGKLSGVTVLDIDPPKGGDDSIEVIEDKICKFPDTLEQQTGNGRQLFFKYDARIPSTVHIAGYAGLDTRSDGGYVVIPPSIHPTGRAYTWLDGQGPGEIQIATLPEAFILHYLSQRRQTVEKPAGAPIIEGGRNEALFKLGCKLKRAGLTESSIGAGLLDYNRENCKPPLPDYEVLQIAGNAWKSSERPAPGKPAPSQVAPSGPPAATVLDEEPPLPAEPTHVTNILQVTDDVLAQPLAPNLIDIWTMLGAQINRQGNVAATADNVLRGLDGLPEFSNFAWWDDFHRKYFTTWKAGNCQATPRREWSDADDLELMLYFQRKLGLEKVTDKVVNQGFRIYAGRRKRNEVKDWLSSLEWDGKERVGMFFPKYMGAKENLYTVCAGENFWTGIIARVYEPGCQLDNMVVLYGAQGRFKSTSVAIIGGQWFAEVNTNVGSKDFYLDLQGKLIVEISEMGSFKNSDLSAIKSAISRRVDRYRLPYGRASEDHPRQCVFVGTTNERQFLKDMTGGRRFWPITIGTIDREAIAAEREQFFAEAVARYRAGNQWYKMPDEATVDEQESHRQNDDWEEPIKEWLLCKDEVRSLDVATECLSLEIGKVDATATRRICKILGKFGYESKLIRNGQDVVRRWVRE